MLPPPFCPNNKLLRIKMRMMMRMSARTRINDGIKRGTMKIEIRTITATTRKA
jgi:hypothetical protein